MIINDLLVFSYVHILFLIYFVAFLLYFCFLFRFWGKNAYFQDCEM